MTPKEKGAMVMEVRSSSDSKRSHESKNLVGLPKLKKGKEMDYPLDLKKELTLPRP